MPPPRFERRDFLAEALRAQERGAQQREAEERKKALESEPCPPDPQLQSMLSDFVNRAGEPPYVLVGSEEGGRDPSRGWKLTPDKPTPIIGPNKSTTPRIKPWKGIAIGANLSLWKASSRSLILGGIAGSRFLDVEPFTGPSIIDAVEEYIPPMGGAIDGNKFNTVYEYIAACMAKVIRGEWG
ncbi:MAG TPA: hypothetical protein VFX79_02265 [Candidatus Saccharimonadales bacterium]|nr:hypothetical protein [Candidatus Saccharimonadales bacterium]